MFGTTPANWLAQTKLAFFLMSFTQWVKKGGLDSQTDHSAKAWGLRLSSN